MVDLADAVFHPHSEPVQSRDRRRRLHARASFLNNWILSRMPIGKAMRDSERLYVSSALAGQLVGGMLISGVVLYLLAVYVVPFGLPAFGGYVRDFSETLAVYKAPAQLMAQRSEEH